MNNPRSIVITGGNSGIGYHISRLALERNFRVYILARWAESCDLTDNPACYARNTNIAHISEIEAAVAWYRKINDQPVDLLVNCSGTGFEKGVAELTEEDYRLLFDVNVKGLIFCTQKFLPLIREKTGTICNLSSIAGIKGFAGWSLYGATKFAVEGFSAALRQELRPKGIRVTVVRPGSVDTPFYANLPKEKKTGFMQPQDIAAAVLYAANLPAEACVENIFINNSAGDL